jgi:pantoate--beta-alanine ligase
LKIVRSPSTASRLCRKFSGKIVLVPTMGALHEGHLALIRRARKMAGRNGSVVVSIFINPTQFGPKEDFSKYPRPFARDTKLCEQNGADLVFAPSPEQMYAGAPSTTIEEKTLSNGLCGASRPGHFSGVCTVVAKLFNIIAPDIAVFGKKDCQQLAIIKRMVRDLNFSVKIVPVGTVREADGLALSSRNRYLSVEERAQAPIIRRALLAAKKSPRSTNPEGLGKLVASIISAAPRAKIDYIEAVDAETLQPVTNRSRKLLIAAAVFFGRTRLIDNIVV